MSSVIRSLMVKVGADLTDFDKSLKRMSKDLKSAGRDMQKTGATLTKSLTLPIAALATASLTSSVSFESAFAGVRKTVDATEQQFEELSQGIRDMSKEMPMAANEIAGIAESAGQLGIETENILKFSKTMADLGVATNLSGEEAASTFAKFANITRMSQGDFDRLGSVIVDLGNNLATTERDIAEMGLRLAGAGTQIGLTEAQILSFAGALSSVGIEAQAGGSAFSKVFVNMQLAVETGNDSLKDFAKVAGMSITEFRKAFKEDASGAVTAFIKGLSRSEERGISAIKVLDDMGISEVRMRDALLRAAGASDVFSGALELGTNAWKENTALTKEAEQRYATTQSKLEILRNKLTDVGITLGDALIPAFTSAIDAVNPFLNRIKDLATNFTELSPSMQTLTVGFIGLAAGIGPVTSVIGKITTGIGGLVGNIGKAVKAIKGGGGFIGALSGILGPAGLVITAIGLVVAGFIAYNAWAKNNKSETDKLVESIKKQDQAWKDLSEQAEENVKANVKDIDYTRELYTELQTLIDANGKLITKNKERVKFILGELNEALDTELTLTGDQIQGYKDAADAIDKLIEKKRAQIILESYEDKYKTAITEGYEQERRAAELSIQIKDKEIERESTLARMEEARLKHAKEGKRYGAELLQYQIQVDEIERELSNLNESYEEHAKVVQDTRDTINAYEKMSAAILSENYDEIRTLNADVSASFKRTSDESSDALWQQVRIAGEAYAKLQAEVDAGGDEVVKRQAADALEAYNNAVKDYERIGGAIPDAMRLGVKDGEPALKTTIEEFRELIYDTASENIYNKFFGIGTSAGEGFISGLDLKKGPIKEKAKSVFGIDTTVSNYFKMHSPSKVMADIGLNAVKGFIAGMENGRKLLKRTVLSINDMLIDDVMSDMATNLTASAHVDVTAQPHDVSIANTIYSGIKSLISGFKSGQSAPVTVVLEVDGTELGRTALPGVIKESKRLNLKLAEV